MKGTKKVLKTLRSVNAKTKVFGVGLNKTGTTTLGRALEVLGYKNHIGYDLDALIQFKDQDWVQLFKTIDQFEVFEDWPWPLMYKEIFAVYPNAKFILTVRKSSSVWYESLCKHAMKSGPTRARELVYGYSMPQDFPEEHMRFYENHNQSVRRFFADNAPEQCKEVCWEDGDGWKEICQFLGCPLPRARFPHINSSKPRNFWLHFLSKGTRGSQRSSVRLLSDIILQKCPVPFQKWFMSKYCPQRIERMKRFQSQTTEYSISRFDELECIYIHIPKCAGISIIQHLFGGMGDRHQTISMYRIFYSKEDFDKYFKFTIVRNPWDRVVSAFEFLTSGGLNYRDSEWTRSNLEKYESFQDFVKHGLKLPTTISFTHFIPQYKFVCDGYGKILVDYVGRYENLDADFGFICKKLGVRGSLPRLNSSQRNNDYRVYYDDEAASIVGRVYRKDIKLFQYTFD